jgi:hypothetical protein
VVDINAKVAGLPYWGWGVAIVGGIGVAYMVNKQSPAESEPSYDDPYSYEGTGTTADYPYPGGGAVYVPGSPAQDVDYGSIGPINNAAWEREALAALIEIGYPPLAAQRALSRFMTSRDLTDDEREMVDRALRAIGPPPDPVDVPDPLPEEPGTNPPTTDPDTDVKPTQPYWQTNIPAFVAKTRSAAGAHAALASLGVNTWGLGVGAGEVTKGLRKLGYKKNANLKPTAENVTRLIQKRTAKKGE